MSTDVTTLDKLNEFAKKLIKNLSDRHIVLLEGPLGAGKTQLVQYVVKHLGGEEICSPSFSIHNSYLTSRGEVDHIDLYRLENPDDIESTGFWDLFEKEKGLIFIEWSNFLNQDEIPIYWGRSRVTFQLGPENERWLHLDTLP